MIVCKSPREIEQMRRANVLVAEVLAELSEHGRARRDDGGPRCGGRAAGAGGRSRARVQGVSWLSGDAVRVGERRGRARHSGGSRAGRRGHHLARHGREARWLLRRLGGHRPGRSGVRRCAAVVARHAGVVAEGDCPGAARRPGLGHRPRDSGARRSGGFFGRARVRRPRHRRAAARGAADCQLRRARDADRGWPRAWCSPSSRW